MENKEIRLANIMLAEFMEVKVDDQGMGGYDWDDLEYRESWDWLMPVVDKIEETFILSNVKAMVYIKICNFDCRIEHDPQHSIAFKEEIEFEDIWEVANSKKEATYKAVILFIKWYNENKHLVFTQSINK